MTEQNLEQMARQMLHGLAEATPQPDMRKLLQRCKARLRRERQRRLVRQLCLIASVVAILVGSLASARPNYAQFSWQQFIINLGSKVGSLITGQQPSAMLVPHSQPVVDLAELRDDIPFAPNIPSWLPNGSTLAQASVIPLTESTATLVMTFQTTNRRSFTIKETNSPTTTASTINFNPETSTTVSVTIGPVEGVMVTHSNRDTRTLFFSGDWMRITIDGNVSEEELIKIATSMAK